jgi:hypothetical protein
MSDFILHLRLEEVQFFLNSGHPTLLQQIIVLVAVLLAFTIYARIKRSHPKQRASNSRVQWALASMLFLILSEPYWMNQAIQGETRAIETLSRVIH